MNSQIKKSVIWGFVAMASLLALYFVILSLVSGWSFAKVQFDENWYWIIGLSAGFGTQIAMLAYLKALRRIPVSGKVVAASGTTSTIAMIACCSHYFINIIPIVGISGLAIIVGQYQTELFWLGVISNLAGIAYLSDKLIKLKTLQTIM